VDQAAHFETGEVEGSGGEHSAVSFCFARMPSAQPVPLVVVVPPVDMSESCEDVLRRWTPHVERRRCILVVPRLDLTPWLISPPDEAELAIVKEKIEACVDKTASMFAVRGVGLVCEMTAGYLGHWLWRQDNAKFDAFLAWNALASPGNVSERTNMGKPIFVWNRPDIFAKIRNDSRAMVDLYSAQGFADVKSAEINEKDSWVVNQTILTTMLDALERQARPPETQNSAPPSSK